MIFKCLLSWKRVICSVIIYNFFSFLLLKKKKRFWIRFSVLAFTFLLEYYGLSLSLFFSPHLEDLPHVVFLFQVLWFLYLNQYNKELIHHHYVTMYFRSFVLVWHRTRCKFLLESQTNKNSNIPRKFFY